MEQTSKCPVIVIIVVVLFPKGRPSYKGSGEHKQETISVSGTRIEYMNAEHVSNLHPSCLDQQSSQMIDTRWFLDTLRKKTLFIPRRRDDVNSGQKILKAATIAV